MRKAIWVWVCFLSSTLATAGPLEIFARGALSKNALSTQGSYIITVTATAGFAFTLVPRVRLEGRYTNSSSLQDKLEVGMPTILGTLNDIKTETQIFSAGLDIDILSDANVFQPFVYAGLGYVVTDRSYYLTEVNSSTVNFIQEPKQTGISANAGLGFRLRLARSLAIETELFAYIMNPQKSDRVVNLYGTVGVRLFL